MAATKTKTKTKAAKGLRRIALTELLCENFKGLRRYHAVFNGSDAIVKAENGVGKTTLYDIFLWVLFGKDSTGRKDFGVRPIDTDPESPTYGEAVKGLVLVGQVGLLLEGQEHIFRKEHHEKVVKGQLKGYETLCWLDEVPKKVSEYDALIKAIMPEDTFKALTDLAYFTSKLHWTERRTVLLEVAGEAGRPDGFDALLALLNGRTIQEFEDVLKDRKKRYAKEREEINPRIDELSRNLADDSADKTALTEKRSLVDGTIAEIEAERRKLLAAEKERQAKIDKMLHLKADRVAREAELKSDDSATDELRQEKWDLQRKLDALKEKWYVADGKAKQAGIAIQSLTSEIAQLMLGRRAIQTEYKTASERPTNAVCYACGQKLPANKVKEIEDKRKADLADIEKRGTAVHEQIKERQAHLAEMQESLKALQTKEKTARAEVEEAERIKNARDAEIDKAIQKRPKPDPTKDKKWQQLGAEIERAEAAIGEPVSQQLEALEERRRAATAELQELTTALAQVDRAKQDRERISELADRERELAQLVADAEKQLAEIDQYKRAQSELIEANVNNLFEYVEFKMFDVQLNEGIRETCEATYNGVPFADLSTGQQILCGVDIVNVLSRYYGTTAPLFIDHVESITLPIEAIAQTIKLCAVPGIKTLQVKVLEKERVVA